MPKVNKFIIREGITLDHIGLGLALIIVGIIMWSINLYIAIVLIVVGLFLAISIKGSILDHHNKRIKFYTNILFLKVGIWKSIANYGTLVYTSSKGKNNPLLSSWRVHSESSSKSYYVQLTGADEDLLLKEFMEYKKGKSLAQSVSKYLNVEFIDEISLARANSLKKRDKIV